jgi:hypothetical protein
MTIDFSVIDKKFELEFSSRFRKANRLWQSEHEKQFLLCMGYCPLCDIRAIMQGSYCEARSLEKSHIPLPRAKGETICMLCREHNLDATKGGISTAGARQAGEIRRYFEQKTLVVGSSWDVQKKYIDSLLKHTMSTDLIRSRLFKIRTENTLCLEQFKEYVIFTAQALFRDNQWIRAYDLLRHANEIEFKNTPTEIQLRLQLEMANCLRRIGYSKLAMDLYFLSSRCAIKNRIYFSNPNIDPALRISETYIPYSWSDVYLAIISSAKENFSGNAKDEYCLYANFALSRISRVRNNQEALEAARIAEQESQDINRAYHRKGNLIQAKAIIGHLDDEEALFEFIDIAKYWETLSPFHSALALARASVAVIGFGTIRRRNDIVRIQKSHFCLQKAREMFGRLEADSFYYAASKNLHTLEYIFKNELQETIGLKSYIHDAQLLLNDLGLDRPEMPGPILIQTNKWVRLDRNRYSKEVVPATFFPVLESTPSQDGVFFRGTIEELINWY